MSIKERPILFSAPMVRAILDGRKTMTRRAVKPQPLYERVAKDIPFMAMTGVRCPYGQPGDRLWAREKHCFLDVTKSALSQFPLGPENNNEVGPDVWDLEVEYSDGTQHDKTVDGIRPRQTRERGETGWRPAIHMPRWASRITLEITAVRVEKLGEISEEDAIAEGVFKKVGHMEGCGDVVETTRGGELVYMNPAQARVEFRYLWEKINGSWTPETWVWVIEFRRVL